MFIYIIKQTSITMADLEVDNLPKPDKLMRQLSVTEQWHDDRIKKGYTRLCTCRMFTCEYVRQSLTCKFGGDSGLAYDSYLREKYSLFGNAFNSGKTKYCSCCKNDCKAMTNKELSCQHGGSFEPFERFLANMNLCM
jgi:hypothetical protein